MIGKLGRVTDARPESDLDDLDWRLLEELQADARVSFNELGRRVHMSAPAVAERVRRLERRGVLSGYCAEVDPTRVGYQILAFVQLRCSLGSCLLKTTTADDYPEVVEIHKLSGAHCSMLKVRATSLAHFEGVLEQLGKHGEMNTHVVLSTQYQNTRVARPSEQSRSVSDAAGWSSPTPNSRTATTRKANTRTAKPKSTAKATKNR